MARGAFEDGERVGVWTFWHPSGVVIGEGPYVAGLRSGRWTFRFADGSPHSDFSGLYEEGERVGP
jgi:antitoxin component YwqK of YwqJK toxin-antitoxin module